MLQNFEPKYCYNDVSVVPSVCSDIKHRSECNTRLENGKLPIFTAPMSSVINENNFNKFEENGINAIIPRTVDFFIRIDFMKKGKWVALSLNEFSDLFKNNNHLNEFNSIDKIRVLIDIANGHMRDLYGSVLEAKGIFNDKLVVMVGNIANPETYKIAIESGVDYVRCSIGNGLGCLTTSNVAINYPIASLLTEITKIRIEFSERYHVDYDDTTKVIADGGIRNYSDVIKALALGADYVMIGGLFGALEDSASKTYFKTEKEFLTEEEFIEDFGVRAAVEYRKNKDNKLYKKFYGMASKDGQIALNGSKTKTSEGLSKYVEITTTIKKWSENMEDYLRSAMSYCNIKDVKDMRNAEVIVISNNSYQSVNK